MGKAEEESGIGGVVCINEMLTDDELRAILAKLERDEDRDVFALACKRWKQLQSSERKKLSLRAGPGYLRQLAARFSGLIELDLSQSTSRSYFPGFSDSDLALVSSTLSRLRSLNLHNCKGVTDAGMVAIGNGLPSLQALDVSCCRKLTDNGLAAVAKGCPNLRSLHLSGCRLVTDELLDVLSKNCCHLEELVLNGCINITNSGLSRLVDKCHLINHLDVTKCSKIGDIGVSQVSVHCSSSLKTLKLLDCYEVGNDSIFSLAESCKYLETLVIGGCRDVSDESILILAVACSGSLKKLRMDWCSNISDRAVSCILSCCKNLELLDIGCCDEISDLAFQGLERGGFESDLKVLKVSNCPKITVSGIALLLKFCKSLEYLDVRSCPNVSEASCDQAGLHFPTICNVNFTGNLFETDCIY